ncbi:hypothetical protein PAMP_020340 [Pampus punctatissimus]
MIPEEAVSAEEVVIPEEEVIPEEVMIPEEATLGLSEEAVGPKEVVRREEVVSPEEEVVGPKEEAASNFLAVLFANQQKGSIAVHSVLPPFTRSDRHRVTLAGFRTLLIRQACDCQTMREIHPDKQTDAAADKIYGGPFQKK